jgi:hypothetical protein
MNNQLSFISSPVAVNLESDSDQRYTPQKWIDVVVRVLGAIDLDPTADPNKRIPARWHITESQNCLAIDWVSLSGGMIYLPKTIFMNPPYSNTAPFLARLTEYLSENPQAIAITLTKEGAMFNQGTQPYFRSHCRAVCLPEGRVSFLSPGGAMGAPNFDVIFGYWGNPRLLEKFKAEFKFYGWVLKA